MTLNKDSIENALDSMTDATANSKSEAAKKIFKLVSDEDTKRELYTLEYQKAAERYQSIYTSIWTNFSYMSIVAGAILSFGGNVYPNVSLLAFLALLPLIFWYLVSFIPMNTYGNETIDRLKDIEKIFRREYKAKLGHFKKFSERTGPSPQKDLQVRFPMTIFKGFGGGNPRVRPAMAIFGGLLIAFSMIFGWNYFTNRFRIEAADLNDTKALAERLIPASSDCNTITNNDLKGVDEIGKLIRQGLNDKSLKSLCEFRKGNDMVASKELQRDLVNAVNLMMEGPFICYSMPDKCDSSIQFSSILNFPQNMMFANRQVLERTYPASIISQTTQLTMVIWILIVIYALIFWRYAVECVKTIIEICKRWCKTEDDVEEKNLTIVSLDPKHGEPTVEPVTDDLLQNIENLMWETNAKLLLRIWNIKDLSEVQWKQGEKEELKVAGIVRIGGNSNSILMDLNRDKMQQYALSE